MQIINQNIFNIINNYKTLKHCFLTIHNGTVSKTASLAGDNIPYKQYLPLAKFSGKV